MEKRIAGSGGKGYRSSPRGALSMAALRTISWLLIALVSAVIAYAADRPSPPPDGLSAEEALRLGERMYREGILPSGEPMMAVVEGDIPVEGSMFTCANCHMRSGLGSNEGTVITPPTNSAKLYRPRKVGQEFSEIQRKHLPYYFQVPDSRPAYTDRTLEVVLNSGIDPSGYRLDPIMPRYPLAERDMDIMVYYLKNLSSSLSPGVTETTIRFATIVGPGVSKNERDAMVLPLRAYVRDRSVRQDYYKARTKYERFAEEMDRSARKLSLSVWELKGPPETWGSQLEEHYRKEPVFAILGGIVSGRWSVVHAFCEKNRIPCILPVTDQPVISGSDWYTLYFSKGPYQEGEAAARYLKSVSQENTGRPVVQVYRKTHGAMDIATGFREARKELGFPPAEEIVFLPEETIPDAFWKDLVHKYGNGVFALWLDGDDLSRLHRAQKSPPSHMVMASATILREGLYHLPAAMRKYTYVTYPGRLPGDNPRTTLAVKQWLKVKKIPETNLSISSKMYFVGTVLTEVFMHMQRNFYRDHFLDVFDMLQDQTYTIANYPRLSFGPGQRYASKGCYIVQLSSGEKPEIIRKSDWVIH